jgi:hypothetical protein
VAAVRAGHLLRLLATDGTDSGVLGGLTNVDGLMEYLARVEGSGRGSMRSELDGLARGGHGGMLVVVLGRATVGELETMARLQSLFRRVIAVVTNGHVPATPASARGLRVVTATEDGAFEPAWSASVAALNRTEVHA